MLTRFSLDCKINCVALSHSQRHPFETFSRTDVKRTEGRTTIRLWLCAVFKMAFSKKPSYASP